MRPIHLVRIGNSFERSFVTTAIPFMPRFDSEHVRVPSVLDRVIYPQLRTSFEWDELLERDSQIVFLAVERQRNRDCCS